MVEADLYLPDDCWEHVFQFLQDEYDDNRLYYLKSLSLVSKHFLSITNSHKLSLSVGKSTCPFLHRLFKRFTNLTSLDLTCFHGDLDALLSQIACFRLKLTSLIISNQPTIPANGLRAFSKKISTLTSLTCSNIKAIYNTDLFLIANCFPLLEELDLNYPRVTLFIDYVSFLDGVEALSTTLFKLRKINFSGHHSINDSCLLNFCKNCELLEEVIMFSCPFLTHDGIASFIRERPTLRSLSVSWGSDGSHNNISSHFIDSLVSLKGLISLNLSSLHISDELLSSIAIGGLPLRRLVLQNCTGHSYVGIFSLLSKCQCIQHLNLGGTYFLNDHHVVKLSLLLGDLVSINLSYCSMLTESAFFSLINNCPSLSEIKMEWTSTSESVENSNSLVDFVVSPSPQLKSLHLGSNSWLSYKNLKIFASIFSNLKFLDLRICHNISEEGICQVLRCCKIRHLNLAFCSGVKLRGMNFQVPKLEVLNLSHTCVDDETLCVISKNCCGLLQLLIESCDNVTKKGVNHVVTNCTQLREINLSYCYNVKANIVDNMVFSRPSLRRIIAPPGYHLSHKKRKLFLRHGCRVCKYFESALQK